MIPAAKQSFVQNIQIGRDTPCWVEGLAPEAKAYGVFLLWKNLCSPCLYLLPEEKKAQRIHQDLKNFLPEKTVPISIWSKKKGSQHPYQILYKLNKEKNLLVTASLQAAVQKVPCFNAVNSSNTLIKEGVQLERDELTGWLVEKGYHSCPMVEDKGEFAVRGSIVDIYSPAASQPVRVEFFADKVESIREFEVNTQRSIRKLNQFLIFPSNGINSQENPSEHSHPLIDTLSHYHLIVDEPLEMMEKIKELGLHGMRGILTKKASLYTSTLSQDAGEMEIKNKLICHSSPTPFYAGDIDRLWEDITGWRNKGFRVTIMAPTSSQMERLKELIQEKSRKKERANKPEVVEKESFNQHKPEDLLAVTLGDLEKGFVFKEARQVIISDADIFQRYTSRGKRGKAPFEEKIKSWKELKRGDYIVHIDYGIGKFKGLVSLNMGGQWSDYFQVDYKGSDRLYIPFNQLDRVHKYIGDSTNPPPVYSLEGSAWDLTKRRARKATRELASSLLKLYSIRKTSPGHSFPSDNPWQLEFEASFPYQETPDQEVAIKQVKQDMQDPTPMDRLVCGDSGYGKTEVAIRASFKAVMDNKQVALLVPTTILADQHVRTFSKRMENYPIRIEMVCRFQSPKRQKEIIQDLKEGKVDIIIGTHRLLQKDVKFKDIGLLIIDEEHRFGVRQKKGIKELRKTVDVLTLSATPIPRSLYMGLTGIYKLSTIFSSPQDRKNIKTEVAPYREDTIRQAILREVSTRGQVFYLYNRVRGIQKVAHRVRGILPHIKIAVAHGQMAPSRLERTVIDFVAGKYDVLVCTSIIESGIDMPNVNTLIVENPEQFGLADLYQIRGRVGRGKEKGYAYFLYRPTRNLTQQAKRRLQTIHQFEGPGAGFKIAMEDMHIRGAGNLLGKEQHGHIASIGFTLYSQLLGEEVKKLKGEKVKPDFPFHIELEVEARIPPHFVPQENERLQMYQKVGQIQDEAQLLDFKQELRDRFGPLPSSTRKLIHLLDIKLVAKEVGICSVAKTPNNMIKITFSPFHSLSEQKKEILRSKFGEEVRVFSQDNKNILLTQPPRKKGELLIWLREILQKLKDMLII